MNKISNKCLSVCFYSSSDEDEKDSLAIIYKDLVSVVVTEILNLEFRSFRIITGGYGGMMNSISSEFKRQAKRKEKGIQTVGITCEAYPIVSPEHEHYNINNDFSLSNDVIINTESFSTRIQVMIESADIFIVLPGKQGTLSEFLLTYDSFRYPTKLLKSRKVKILVHEYWKELISNNYFRNFDSDIVNFFREDDFRNKLGDVVIAPLNYSLPNLAKTDLSIVLPSEKIKTQFEDYYKNILIVLYGSAAKNTRWRNNLLSLDFGYWLSDRTTKEGEFLTYSTSDYKMLLGKFFKDNNSIMFDEEIKSGFKVVYLQGKFQTETEVIFKSDNLIPRLEDHKSAPSFNNWVEFLNNNDYGQTLIWRGITQKGDQDSYHLNLSIFLLFNSQLSSGKIEAISQLTDGFLVDVATNKIAELFGKKEKELNHQATLAIISKVRARNFSHHIGSHVSNRATNLQIKKRVDFLLKKFSQENDHNFTNTPELVNWLDYFSDRLDRYEIHRNEYLSDFDLSPKSVMFYRGLVLPFCENMFLMDNIGAGEGLHYKDVTTNRLKIKCLINKNEIEAVYPDLAFMFSTSEYSSPINYPNNFPYLLKNKQYGSNNTLENAINFKVLIGPEDVEICVHSEQAIYSILENFIRNSAKHNVRDSDSELIVFLDLRKEETHYSLYLYDNRSKAKANVLFNEDTAAPGLYQKIIQSLLEQGKPRRANWGYVDMKIDSFLLWKDIDDLDDSHLHDNFKLVTVNTNENGTEFGDVDETIIPFKDEVFRFGYKLKLSVARKILWVGEFNSPRSIRSFETDGLYVVESLENLSHPSQKNNGLSSYQFAVINKTFDYEQYLKVEKQLPVRVIVLNNACNNVNICKPSLLIATASDIPMDDIHKMLRWCWQRWLTRNNQHINLYLYFENEEVVKQWEDKWEDNSGIVKQSNGIRLNQGLELKFVDSIQEQETITDSNINVVYDRHGNAFAPLSDGRPPRIRCETQNEKTSRQIMNFATRHSNIFFDKGSEDFALLNNPPTGSHEKELMIYKLMDAATTNVFIVDERISDYAFNDKPDDFYIAGVSIGTRELGNRNWSMYAAGKLFVIHEIKNSKTTYFVGRKQEADEKVILDIGLDRIKLYSNIKHFDGVDKLQKDILIIHRTYLNKNIAGEDFLKMANRQFGAVFITSGGGYPHNLDINCRFISFSTLESYVNMRLSKNKLNNIVRTNAR